MHVMIASAHGVVFVHERTPNVTTKTFCQIFGRFVRQRETERRGRRIEEKERDMSENKKVQSMDEKRHIRKNKCRDRERSIVI